MKIRSKLLSVTVALGISMMSMGLAQADKTMVISSWLPPEHMMNAIVWPEFIRRIEQATYGRVKGKIEYGLASPTAQIDLIEDGGADAAWIFHGYNPGRFVVTKMIEMPSLKGDSAAASAAYWRAHEKYLSKANEHDGVTPVAMMVHAPGSLHLAKSITSLEDVKGMKIRSGGGVMGDVLSGLHVAKVQVSAPKVYETVANGVADGVFFPGDTIAILRLTEVLPYTYRVPNGFYRGSCSIVMNDDFLADVGAADRVAILNVLGEDFSAFAGKAFDDADEQGMAAQRKTGQVVDLDAKAAAKFTGIVEMIRTNVMREISAKGIDGPAALKLIEETMAEYSAISG